jgi:hypothetical protein
MNSDDQGEIRMASIHKEIVIEALPEKVWAALRDVGSVHKRLVPGILVDAYLDGDARVVTFSNGLVARELLVDIDDNARRFAYAVVQGRPTHHNASMQVFAQVGERSLFVWIADFLPNEVAEPIGAMMEYGIAVIKQTLETKSS